jgi:WD40 repeat protein
MATNCASYPLGLIASGMSDGHVKLWDPVKLSSGDPECLLATILQHQGAVSGLQFNPMPESSHLLATGALFYDHFVYSHLIKKTNVNRWSGF